MLSSGQVETFRRDGALALRGFFDAAEVGSWRRQILGHFRRPTGSGAWRAALTTIPSDCFQPEPDLSPRSHGRLRLVYEQLYGPADWEGRTRLIIRAGDDPAEWRGATVPHIDIPFNAPVRTLVNSVTYLSQVETRGGAFIYWPGSHRIAWSYYRRQPQDFLGEGERSYNEVYERIAERVPTAPIEFLGAPGDVLLVHALILHSASINKRSEARLALFGRWGVAARLARRHRFQDDLWAGWRLADEPARRAAMGGR